MEWPELFLWYGTAAGCTAWICYTDIRRCWIADAPVLALALALSPGCPDWGAWVMLVASFCLAAPAALVYRRWKGASVIPFGPFLLLGWWLAQGPFPSWWPGGWLW